MAIELKLHHNLIDLPNGKKADDIVAERHDMVLLFDATKANPNGDPDMGNMPRRQPDTLKGLVTDVCLKRKIRNFFSLYNPDGTLITNGSPFPGYQIFIRENAILKDGLDLHYQLVGKRVFDELVRSLRDSEYLDDDGEKSVRDKQYNEEEYPDPKNCVAHISKHYNGLLKVDTISAAVAKELKASGRVTQEVTTALDGLKLSAEVKDEKGVTKAILEAAKKVSPRGTATAYKSEVEAALERVSPWALLRKAFGQLELERLERDALCEAYFDNRAFGAVISTDGPLAGSFYGQVRGPIQFAFAESLDKTLQLDSSITRCAVASRKNKDGPDEDAEASDETGNRTMGRKHVVDYGLYRTHIYLSPAFAAKTGFTYYDLDNFLFALTMMYRDDAAAGRTGMRVVGLIDFKHSSALGDEHAHKLFAEVKVNKRDLTKEYPQSLEDYDGTTPGHCSYPGPKSGPTPSLEDYDGAAPGHDGKYVCVRSVKENSVVRERVWAKRIIWDIQATTYSGATSDGH